MHTELMFTELLAHREYECNTECNTIDCSGNTYYSGYCLNCFHDICTI
jgi:hypothetical protein